MSLKAKDQEDIFVGTYQLEGLLSPNDPMVIFSKEVYPAFKDDDFKDFYSEKGRSAVSPSLMALVTILQFKENLSDVEATEACVRRIDWKIALHLPIEFKDIFHPSTLCYFRRRLKEHEQTGLIFDKLLKIVEDKGFIKKKSKQRIDATHIVKHLHRISTTDLLFRAVKCVAEEIEKKYPKFYEEEIPEHIKERYEGSFSSFGMSKAKRADKQAEIVEDGFILKQIAEDEKLELEQIPIMDTIIEENVIIRRKTIGEREFIETEEIQSPKQTISDPRDPTIKLGIKGKTSWVGEKCHIIETAEKDNQNFIVGMLQQGCRENDSLIHDTYRKHNAMHGFTPEKIYVDTGYMSGREMDRYSSTNCILMGYTKIDSKKQNSGFQQENFKIDPERGRALCPAGKVAQRLIPPTPGTSFSIGFKETDCFVCDFRNECLGSLNAKHSRHLHISANHRSISERRELQRTREFQKEMSVRAQIEGTISEAVRCHGLRKIKYKNKSGRELQYWLVGAAINLKRLLRVLSNPIPT